MLPSFTAQFPTSFFSNFCLEIDWGKTVRYLLYNTKIIFYKKKHLQNLHLFLLTNTACRCFKWELSWSNQRVHYNRLALPVRVWWRPHKHSAESVHQRKAIWGDVHQATPLQKFEHTQVHAILLNQLSHQVQYTKWQWLHGHQCWRRRRQKRRATQISREYALCQTVHCDISLRVFFGERTQFVRIHNILKLHQLPKKDDIKTYTKITFCSQQKISPNK